VHAGVPRPGDSRLENAVEGADTQVRAAMQSLVCRLSLVSCGLVGRPPALCYSISPRMMLKDVTIEMHFDESHASAQKSEGSRCFISSLKNERPCAKLPVRHTPAPRLFPRLASTFGMERAKV